MIINQFVGKKFSFYLTDEECKYVHVELGFLGGHVFI